MPRHYPTKQIDEIGLLEKRPEKAAGEYFQSVKQARKQHIKPPNWDSPGDSQELMYIHNEREHEAMLVLQKEMLENSKRQARLNIYRTRKVYAVQAHLRKRFITVNGFIKDCVDKKRRAEREAAEEKQVHNYFRDAVKDMKGRKHELVRFSEAFRRTVAKFQPYERVLEEVVAASDIFESVQDCIGRCDALMLTQVEISVLEAQTMQEIEDMRRRMAAISKEAALTVLGMKNDLSELERGYNIARGECLRWEKTLIEGREIMSRNDLNQGRALDGIHQIYRMLCQRRNMTPEFKRADVENQLDFIKDEVEILRAAFRQCKKLDPTNIKTEIDTMHHPPC